MCDLTKIHAEIIRLSETAADLIVSEFSEPVMDEFVIRSAIRQTILNLGDVPAAIFSEAENHTRSFLANYKKSGEVQ